MKKILLLTTLTLSSFSLTFHSIAIDIETDERGQIILNHDICELAQLRLNNVAKDVSEVHFWEIPKFLHDIEVAANMVQRCQEKGFLPN
jgi:hypothetical protein